MLQPAPHIPPHLLLKSPLPPHPRVTAERIVCVHGSTEHVRMQVACGFGLVNGVCDAYWRRYASMSVNARARGIWWNE